MSRDDEGDGGVNRDSVSPHASPKWLRSSDEGGLSATPTISTRRGALSGAIWRTSAVHDSSARCRHAAPSRQQDRRHSKMASAPAARRKVGAPRVKAAAPHVTQAHARVATSACVSGVPMLSVCPPHANGTRSIACAMDRETVSRAPCGRHAPATSATAHHVSHATGGCIRPGGSRAVRRSRFVASLRMLSMSRDPSDEPRAIRSVRPNFAQLSQCSAMSRIPLA